jgi:hypothetical protein
MVAVGMALVVEEGMDIQLEVFRQDEATEVEEDMEEGTLSWEATLLDMVWSNPMVDMNKDQVQQQKINGQRKGRSEDLMDGACIEQRILEKFTIIIIEQA